MLYVIFVLLYLIALTYVVMRNRSMWQPVGISEFSFVIYGIMFVIVPSVQGWDGLLSDSYFSLMLIMGLLGLLLGFHYIRWRNKKQPVIHHYCIRSNVFTELVLWGIIIAYMLLMVYSIAETLLTDGVVGAFTRDRVVDRLDAYGEGGGFRSFISNVIRPFAVIAAGIMVKKRPWVILIFFISFTLSSILDGAHRFTMLLPLLLIVVYCHFYVRRLGLPVFVGLGVILLALLSAGNILRRGNIHDALNLSSRSVVIGLDAFGPGRYLYYNLYPDIKRGSVDIEKGRGLYYYLPASFVPRAFWNEKPMVNVNARLTEVYTGRVGTGGVKSFIMTFTAWGEGYYQFGLMGIMFYSILICITYSEFVRLFGRFEGGEFVILYFVCSMPMQLRTSLDSGVVRMVVQMIAFGVLALFIYRRSRNGGASAVATACCK